MLTLFFEPILGTTIPEVAEPLKSVINKMLYRTKIKLANFLDPDNTNLVTDNLNTTIEVLETNVMSTLLYMIHEHAECNNQAMANTQVLDLVLGLLMYLIGSRQHAVWAGKSQ